MVQLRSPLSWNEEQEIFFVRLLSGWRGDAAFQEGYKSHSSDFTTEEVKQLNKLHNFSERLSTSTLEAAALTTKRAAFNPNNPTQDFLKTLLVLLLRCSFFCEEICESKTRRSLSDFQNSSSALCRTPPHHSWKMGGAEWSFQFVRKLLSGSVWKSVQYYHENSMGGGGGLLLELHWEQTDI